MRIVTASGKGGTGKTTVSTSLATAASENYEVLFLDCDVEAPNAALFLKPELNTEIESGILIPVVDEANCALCGNCVEACQFNAMALTGKSILIFPKLCHGCGSCTLVCPDRAITEKFRSIGNLERGPVSESLYFAHGRMNIGEAMGVPIIRDLKKWEMPVVSELVILDSPPGASCPVVETLHGADFALLVTEPTPFGLHDLKQVVSIVQDMKIPAGVVINRDGIGDEAVEEFCQEQGIPILMRIPMDRKIAEGIARGYTLLEVIPEYKPDFLQVLKEIQSAVHQ